MQRLQSRILTFISLFLLILTLVVRMPILSPVFAQLSLPQTLENTLPEIFATDSNKKTEIAWIRLDGRPLFRIAGGQEELSERIREIQKNLKTIQNDYLDRQDGQLEIEIRTDRNLPTLYINDRYLLTATHLDARLQGSELATYTETLQNTLTEALRASKTERQPKQIRIKTKQALIVLVIVAIVSSLLSICFQKTREIAVSFTRRTSYLNSIELDTNKKSRCVSAHSPATLTNNSVGIGSSLYSLAFSSDSYFTGRHSQSFPFLFGGEHNSAVNLCFNSLELYSHRSRDRNVYRQYGTDSSTGFPTIATKSFDDFQRDEKYQYDFAVRDRHSCSFN